MSESDNSLLSKFAVDEKTSLSSRHISIPVNSADRRRRGAKLKSRLLALRRFHTPPRCLREKGCRSPSFMCICKHSRQYVCARIIQKHTPRRTRISTTHERAHGLGVITPCTTPLLELKWKKGTLGKGGFLINFRLSVFRGGEVMERRPLSGLSALHLKPSR